MSLMRLDKYLAQMGLGTRSEVKKLLKGGSVTVNGLAEKSPDRKLDPGQDLVCAGGRTLSFRKFVGLMLNKPSGCITATDDNRQRTVMDYIEHDRKRELFPVGRLDIDTEGLLLLVNDGELAHRLLSPKHHVDKTYFVRTEGRVTQEDARAFADGVEIGEKRPTLPAKLEIIKSDECSESLLTICEGKFHQVKRMFEVRGKHVCYLKRISMGGITLDESLAPGQWRELTEAEERLLYHASTEELHVKTKESGHF